MRVRDGYAIMCQFLKWGFLVLGFFYERKKTLYELVD